MARVQVLVLRAAGTNCDVETEFAWQAAGATAERVHVRRIIERPQLLDDYQVLTIPGGFSYGDDISAGRVLAVQLERHLLGRIRDFIDAGKLVLGICNGFQVLVKAGLLPDGAGNGSKRVCTITYNDPPGFQDRWIRLRANDTPCVFLEPGRHYELPIAHAEGRVVFATREDYEQVVQTAQNALCYVPPPGDSSAAPNDRAGSGDARVRTPSASAGLGPGARAPGSVVCSTRTHDQAGAPYNPNGSMGDIAGLCDRSGRVLGLMPHPERFITWTQHPCWTSQPPRDPGDGLAFFQRAVAYVA